MAAVLALGKALGIEGDISIATTKYIMEDKTASFREIVESTGRPYYYVDPGLENSKIPGVQIYAQGYVKEGVGMGGASLLAGHLSSHAKAARRGDRSRADDGRAAQKVKDKENRFCSLFQR